MAGSLGEAQLQLSVDQKSFDAGLNQAKAKVEKFGSTASASFERAGGSIRGMATALAGITGVVGLGALARDVARVGQESERSKIQLSALAGAYGETTQAMAAAARIAGVLEISNKEARESFAQLYGALRGTGIGLKELEVIYVGINKAARLSGAGTAEASSAILQLKQAFSSGRAQGDELRSVLENLPVFAQAVAKAMGTNVGALRQLGAEGKITNDVLFKAAARVAGSAVPAKTALEKLAKEFENTKEVAAEAFGPALNSALRKISVGMRVMYSYLSDNKGAIIGFAKAVLLTGKALGPLALGIGAVVAAYKAWALAAKGAALAQSALLALSGPKGWAILAGAALATGVAIAGLDALGKKGEASIKKAVEEAKKAQSEFDALLANSGGSLGNGNPEDQKKVAEAYNRVREAQNRLSAAQADAIGPLTRATVDYINGVKEAQYAVAEAKKALAANPGSDELKNNLKSASLDLQSAMLDGSKSMSDAFREGKKTADQLKESGRDLRDALFGDRGGKDGVNKYISGDQADARQKDANSYLFGRAKDIANQLGVVASFSGSLVDRNEQMADFIRAGQGELNQFRDIGQNGLDLESINRDLAFAVNNLQSEINMTSPALDGVAEQLYNLVQKDWSVRVAVNGNGNYSIAGDVTNRFMS